MMYANVDRLIMNLKMLLNKCVRRIDILVQPAKTTLQSQPAPHDGVPGPNYVSKNLHGI